MGRKKKNFHIILAVNSRQFLKTTSDWKAFFYMFYELKIYL